MKWLNNIIEKMGIDKVLHLLVGFCIVGLFSGHSFEITLVGVFVALVTGLLKEQLDEKADYEDAVATAFGGIVGGVVFLLRMVLLGF